MSEPFKLKEITEENCKAMSTKIGQFVLQKMYIEPMAEREIAPTTDEMDLIIHAQMHVIENLLTNTIANILMNVNAENYAASIGNILGTLQIQVLNNVSKVLKPDITGETKEGLTTLVKKGFKEPIK